MGPLTTSPSCFRRAAWFGTREGVTKVRRSYLYLLVLSAIDLGRAATYPLVRQPA